MKKLVVLTGAGISADSGIKTFRDADGLWEGHDVMEVASPEGYRRNPELVLDFYNQRRKQLKEVSPNRAHFLLAELEDTFEVVVITQNVDNLHERGGSKNIIHLHGELLKVRSVSNPNIVLDWTEDLYQTHKAPDGSDLRPHIVWFGEAVPMLDAAIEEIRNADIVLIVGTSMQVYPAAMLYEYAPKSAPIYYVDPKASLNTNSKKINCIDAKAAEGIDQFIEEVKTF